MKQKTYENYPAWIIVVSNLLQIAIYGVGAYIILYFGIFWAVLYLFYCLLIEARVLKEGCINCYYYGKACFSGKGKICRLFFKKGDPNIFAKTQITWVNFVPELLISLVPLAAGIIILINNFTWTILLLLALLLILAFPVTGFLRGSLICNYCKQGKIGCPAAQMFDKKKK